MTKMIYRGVEYDADNKPAASLVEQVRKVEMVYRGVAHDGKNRPAPVDRTAYDHIYRGIRYA